MNKKTIIIIIACLAILIGIIIFLMYNPAKKPQKIENPAQDEIYYSELSFDGQSLYYLNQNGDSLKKWDLKSNQIEEIVKFPFQNIDDLQFTSDESQAFIHWTNPQNAIDANYWLIDLKQKKLTHQLSGNILNLAISPDNQKIAYHYLDWENNKNILAIADLAGSNPQELMPLDDDSVEIIWFDNTNFIYYSLPSEAAKIQITKIDLARKESSIIAADVFAGLAKKLNGSNRIMLEMTKDENADFQLEVYDGGKNQFLKLNLLLPIELVTPLNQDQIYTLYFDKNNQFGGLMKIDLNSGKIKQKSNYYLRKYQPENIFVAPDEKLIYFVSDHKLYKINL